MPQFMLLLRYPEGAPTDISPAAVEQLITHVRAWHHKMREQAQIVSIGKLKDGEGQTLRLDQGDLVVDGPYSETKEVLAGFFLLEAAAYEEAVALAGECPMLAFGGSVEVRALDVISATLSS